MKLAIVRSDERLIHDKVINEWCKRYETSRLLIADDNLVSDSFMTSIYKALVPLRIKTEICSIDEAKGFLDCQEDSVFLLCSTPVQALRLIRTGIQTDKVSLADRRYMSSRIKIPKEYKQAINDLLSMQIRVTAQIYPEDEEIVIQPYDLE